MAKYMVPIRVTRIEYIGVDANNKREAKEGAYIIFDTMADGDESIEKFEIARGIAIKTGED